MKGVAMPKFFTYEQRLDLQKDLKDGLSMKVIGCQLEKDPTTISGEIRNNSSEVATGYSGFPFNECKNRMNCSKKKLCGKECSRKSILYCKLCPKCNGRCDKFVREIFTARFRPPYVCNGCETIGKCSLMKTIYDAEYAQIKARNRISESRSGVCKSEA
jgi:hypothetical protein